MVKDIDRGWRRFMGDVKEFNRYYTKVGLPENATVAPPSKMGSGHEEVLNMSELVTIGAVHEFGAPNRNIPERSFMRSAIDQNVDKITAVQKELFSRVVKGQSVRLALGTLGSVVERLTKKQIRDGNFESLAESTEIRKKSTKPLIDTAQMINSIQHVEVIGGRLV